MHIAMYAMVCVCVYIYIYIYIYIYAYTHMYDAQLDEKINAEKKIVDEKKKDKEQAQKEVDK
jgi:hypothetical protein